jgi:predicted alpha/beta hydrolase family esterase
MNLHIDKMILAAPLNDQQGADYALTSRPGKESEISYLRNFIHQNFDFDTIKSKVNEFTFLLSDNDHLVPYEETRSYFENISPKAKFIKLHEYGHINEKAGITELPEVVNAITNETNTRS